MGFAGFLKQSTAVDISLGPFVDSTDGVTAETGLTISQADVRLKKNNGAWAQVNDNTSATHEENGYYEKELDATDTNTVGILRIAVSESGALPVLHDYYVLEEAVYDALFAASALGYVANAPVNVEQWNGTNVATPTVAGVPEVDVTHWKGSAAPDMTGDAYDYLGTNLGALGANATEAGGTGDHLTALATQASVNALPSQSDITGGAYSLDTDANGRIRIVDGTGAGELDTLSGTVLLRAATQASIDAIEANADAIKEATDYPDDYVYVDATNGSAGTTVGTNGTFANPVTTLSDAATIATSRGVKKIRLLPTSNTSTVFADAGDYDGFIIDLNGNRLDVNVLAPATYADARFISSSSDAALLNDLFGGPGTLALAGNYYSNISLTNPSVGAQVYVQNCRIEGPLTVSAGGSWVSTFANCYGIQETTTINMGSVTGSTIKLRFNGWSGDMSVTNMRSGQTLEVYGYGGLISIASSCTGGTVKYTSHMEVTNNGSGMTLTLASEPTPWNSAWDAEIESEVTDALNAYDPPTNAEMEARTLAAASYATAAALATVDGNVDLILADTGTDGVIVAGFTTAAKAEIEQESLDALQQTVPDSVPADGSRPNMQQAAYMLLQATTEIAITGTSMVVKKPDGSTTLFTITLDDDTTPTSKTRSG